MGKIDMVSKDSLADEIMNSLASKGSEWTTRRELLRSMNKKWHDLSVEIANLVESELIECQPTENKRGPKSEAYRVFRDD